jgi:hypothetical protein
MSEDLPSWREKKTLLWGGQASAEEQVRAGDTFLREGRHPEALDFYERARHGDGVRAVLREAVSRGDWHLFRRCREFLGGELRDELAALARNALAAGKHLYAFRAARALRDEPLAARALEKIREVHPGSQILVKQLEEEQAQAPAPGSEGGGKAPG